MTTPPLEAAPAAAPAAGPVAPLETAGTPRSLEEIDARIREESRFVDDLLAEIGRVIVGQRAMIERLLIGLLSDGHVLLEGVPGLAKTLAVRTLAATIRSGFGRVQFTPDLLPADLIGTMVFNPRSGEFNIQQGPIFTNILLADEINRAPAKVQSALLEAMQEKQVTIGGRTFRLQEPFLVLATQNPIEQEGTYPLPEAQVDRFMLKLVVTYPAREDEREMLDRMTAGPAPSAAPVVDGERVLRARRVIHDLYVDARIKEYALDLVRATREPAAVRLPDLAPLIEYGASPRAAIYLVRAAKAHAFLRGRGYVIPDDVKSLGMDVLRHRLLLTYEAEAEDVTADELLRRIFETVPVP
ncbi:MAG: MoxR family ATPase [Gemmatimonadetes bacterium]|nr:MoxR family ATPase [Gemmatimonadota bacterium]